MGIDFFEHRRTTISDYLKTFLNILFQGMVILLQYYFLVYDLNENAMEKFLLYITAPGTTLVLLQYIHFVYNKKNFLELMDWVKSRYLKRQTKLVDDLSKAYFLECPDKIEKIGV